MSLCKSVRCPLYFAVCSTCSPMLIRNIVNITNRISMEVRNSCCDKKSTMHENRSEDIFDMNSCWLLTGWWITILTGVNSSSASSDRFPHVVDFLAAIWYWQLVFDLCRKRPSGISIDFSHRRVYRIVIDGRALSHRLLLSVGQTLWYSSTVENTDRDNRTDDLCVIIFRYDYFFDITATVAQSCKTFAQWASQFTASRNAMHGETRWERDRSVKIPWEYPAVIGIVRRYFLKAEGNSE